MRYLADETASTPGTGEMWRIWQSGDYWGSRRPVARATVQKVVLHEYGHDNGLFRSLLFNQSQRPVELPNVKSVTINRGTDYDAATATVELWNVAPLPYGTAPDAGAFERPGWYTPDRGAAGNPWGDTANQWSDYLVENRVVRTFEGYGVDASVRADEDTHLLQTGLWLIDEVLLRSDRTIVLTCRDLGKTLIEQLLFPPVLRRVDYPIYFTASAAASQARQVTTYDAATGALVTTGGVSVRTASGTDRSRAVNVAASAFGTVILSDAMGGSRRRKVYSDYAAVVRHLCALGGFHWPEDGYIAAERSAATPTHPGDGELDAGVYGYFQPAHVAGINDLAEEQFEKKPIMDAVMMVRDILGYIFMIDEYGAAQFRMPNVWTIRNVVQTTPDAEVGYTAFLPEIDEHRQLSDLTVKLSDRNGRSEVLVAKSDGTVGASVSGREPNPIGLKRMAIWTDQRFATVDECRVMADMIAVRYVYSYRSTTVTIPGCPMLQPDDQVRIYDRVSGEYYVHYIKSISSRFDAESGSYTMTLETHWLGKDPDSWTVDAAALSPSTQAYLGALGALLDVRLEDS